MASNTPNEKRPQRADPHAATAPMTHNSPPPSYTASQDSNLSLQGLSVSSQVYPPPQGDYPLPPQGSYSPPPGFYPYPPPQCGYGYPPPQRGYGYPRPQQGYAPPTSQLGFVSPYPPGPPITMQPIGQAAPRAWMPKPKDIANCPPGLEFLSAIDQLLVQQHVEMLELVTNYESENRYSICNTLGQQMYFAQEVSDPWNRNISGSNRNFEMKITDNFGNLVINLRRPYACTSCCYPCCLNSMEVSAPPGTLVGTIEQEWDLLYPKLVIKNANGDIVLRIKGPCCTTGCCSFDIDFLVLSADGSRQVGKIRRQWSGFFREMYTDADNFGITFPMELDVQMKAVMLGACFLIDFMYYESSPNNDTNQRNRGYVMDHRRY